MRDPFGHRWFVATAIEADDVPVEDAPGRRFGDIGYVVFDIPDGDRAARFFGALFGWELHGGYQPGAFHIASITPPAGIDTGSERRTRASTSASTTSRRPRHASASSAARCCRVADYDSGGNAECVDDQGLRFDLFRPKPGY